MSCTQRRAFALAAIFLLVFSTTIRPGIADDNDRSSRWSRRDLDLGSTTRNVSPGRFVRETPVTILVGGDSRTITSSTLVTPAERVAIHQMVTTGQQSLELSALGAAVGGSVVLSSRINQLNNLVIPAGVTAIRDFGTSSSLSVLGNLVNAGTFQAVSTNAATTVAAITANNIINESGAVLSSVVPSVVLPGISGIFGDIGLNLTAVQNILNAGTISSSGSLFMTAGESITNSSISSLGGKASIIQSLGSISFQAPVVNNSGLIAAANGNVNFSAMGAANVVINNSRGVIEALAGAINVNSPSFVEKVNTIISGGDLHANAINIFGGAGNINVDVQELLGVVNVSGCTASILASSPVVEMGAVDLSGDPFFSNLNGPFIANLPINAKGDVTVISNTLVIAKEINSTGNVFVIADADFIQNSPKEGLLTVTGFSKNTGGAQVDKISAGGTNVAIVGNGSVTVGTISFGAPDAKGNSIVIGSQSGNVTVGGITAPTGNSFGQVFTGEANLCCPLIIDTRTGIVTGSISGGKFTNKDGVATFSGGQGSIVGFGGAIPNSNFTINAGSTKFGSPPPRPVVQINQVVAQPPTSLSLLQLQLPPSSVPTPNIIATDVTNPMFPLTTSELKSESEEDQPVSGLASAAYQSYAYVGNGELIQPRNNAGEVSVWRHDLIASKDVSPNAYTMQGAKNNPLYEDKQGGGTSASYESSEQKKKGAMSNAQTNPLYGDRQVGIVNPLYQSSMTSVRESSTPSVSEITQSNISVATTEKRQHGWSTSPTKDVATYQSSGRFTPRRGAAAGNPREIAIRQSSATGQASSKPRKGDTSDGLSAREVQSPRDIATGQASGQRTITQDFEKNTEGVSGGFGITDPNSGNQASDLEIKSPGDAASGLPTSKQSGESKPLQIKAGIASEADSPRDAASGLPTGKREPDTVTFKVDGQEPIVNASPEDSAGQPTGKLTLQPKIDSFSPASGQATGQRSFTVDSAGPTVSSAPSVEVRGWDPKEKKEIQNNPLYEDKSLVGNNPLYQSANASGRESSAPSVSEITQSSISARETPWIHKYGLKRSGQASGKREASSGMASGKREAVEDFEKNTETVSGGYGVMAPRDAATGQASGKIGAPRDIATGPASGKIRLIPIDSEVGLAAAKRRKGDTSDGLSAREIQSPRDIATGQASGQRTLIQDFEKNTEGVSGGFGITDPNSGNQASNLEIKSPRDAASGLPTGKQSGESKPLQIKAGIASEADSPRDAASGLPTGRTATVDAQGPSIEVVSPRDAASGLPTGKRQPKSVITFTVDAQGPSVRVSPRDAASGLPTGKRQHGTPTRPHTQGHVQRGGPSIMSPGGDAGADGANEIVSPRDATSGQATGKRKSGELQSADFKRDAASGRASGSGTLPPPKGMDVDSQKGAASSGSGGHASPTYDAKGLEVDSHLYQGKDKRVGDVDEDGADEIVSPRDAASGLPTGKRQPKPVITFTVDAQGPAVRVSQRDVASGLPTGKRQHGVIKTTTDNDSDGDGAKAKVDMSLEQVTPRHRSELSRTATVDEQLPSTEVSPRDAASGQATGKRQHGWSQPGDKSAVEREIVSPRDVASGLPTGKRQHGWTQTDGPMAVEHEVKSPRDSASGMASGRHGVATGAGTAAGAATVVSPRDAASGQATGKRSFTVDSTGPTVEITAPRDAASGLPTGKRQHGWSQPGDKSAVEREIVSPRDVASGLPTGKRQHGWSQPGDKSAVEREIVSPRDAASGMTSGKRTITQDFEKNTEGVSGGFGIAAPDTGDQASTGEIESPRDVATGQASGKRLSAPRDIATGQASGKRESTQDFEKNTEVVSGGFGLVDPDTGDQASGREASSGMASGKRAKFEAESGLASGGARESASGMASGNPYLAEAINVFPTYGNQRFDLLMIGSNNPANDGSSRQFASRTFTRLATSIEGQREYRNSADSVDNRTAQSEVSTTKPTTLLVAPAHHPAVIKTTQAYVLCKKNSIVFFIDRGKDVAVYNLHSKGVADVVIAVGDKHIVLGPGKEFVLTKDQNGQFDDVNPGSKIAHREPKERDVNGKRCFTADFSIPSALITVEPLRRILRSSDASDRKVARQLLKDAVILSYLNGEAGPFKQSK